jgi:periplasmic protein TonB
MLSLNIFKVKGLKRLIVGFIALVFSFSLLANSDKGYVGDDEIELDVLRVHHPAPTYPRKALRKGQEGFVVIEFDVDTDGAILDPYVIESVPTGVFERAAIKSVRKWLYQAPVYEGVSVKVNNVQVRLTFALAD